MASQVMYIAEGDVGYLQLCEPKLAAFEVPVTRNVVTGIPTWRRLFKHVVIEIEHLLSESILGSAATEDPTGIGA